MPLSIDLVDAIQRALRGERDDIHTCMPGKVVRYYPTDQTADVQLQLKKPLFDENSDRQDGTSYPMLPKVPVIWPRAGGYIHGMPMTAGDFVWVMFSEGGTGEYRNTGQESEPFDVSRHTITYPYCLPGASPDVLASTDPDIVGGQAMVVGKEGGPQKIVFTQGDGIASFPQTQIGTGAATIKVQEANPGALTPAQIVMGTGSDAAAKASVVDQIISLLKTWTVVANDGGAALKAAAAALPSTSKSTYVKID